ncbi:uncharacterized protein EV422DRAFT_57775 [Fimicolochytrium jonesii]|uniref:uncharacterized protein n=1 Tax=Fimicolochytrium jonesii TaxID=1396493 RepID=UPI0022FDF70A|nr:uncharacterized protein EV422DRAFT_57775 [Fimicolochytrium jonesii]KAI8820639.1 hypothetical protein EV422DRAFT_57775 [Fimicolochytrium jonesii]
MASQLCPWDTLPFEIWSRIFCTLEDPLNFSLTCRRFYRIAEDPMSMAMWLIHTYGRPLVFYKAFQFHRQLLSRKVAVQLRHLGAKLQRFLLQYIVRHHGKLVLADDAEKGTRRNDLSVGAYAFFVAEAYRQYGEEAAFGEDDARIMVSALFEKNDTVEAQKLVVDYCFVPLRAFTSQCEEIVYRTSRLDVTLLDHMLANGLDPADVNDGVLRRAISEPEVSAGSLKAYLDRGFFLTDSLINAAIRKCDRKTLDALRQHIPATKLMDIVSKIFIDNLAPDFNFSITLVTFLQEHFKISEAVAECAILEPYARQSRQAVKRLDGPQPNGDSVAYSTTRTTSLFPTPLIAPLRMTRCYRQQKPAIAWRWVLRTYGPSHRFCEFCFSDALLRMTHSDGGPPPAYEFLAAGVRFRPYHARYLSAIAAVSSGFAKLAAHDLLQRLRSHMFDDITDCKQVDENSMSEDPSSDSLRKAWIDALRAEVDLLRSLPSTTPPPETENKFERDSPVWAVRKPSDPAFPAGWFLREVEGILAELVTLDIV